MYGIATGGLGWWPEVAWNTPIPEIVVAMEGKIKWVRMCNGEDVRPAHRRFVETLRKIGK